VRTHGAEQTVPTRVRGPYWNRFSLRPHVRKFPGRCPH